MNGIHKTAFQHEAALDPSELIEPGDREDAEDVEIALVEHEAAIAKARGLRSRFVRRELVALVRRGEHEKDALLARWLELYSTHLYWARRECGGDEPPLDGRASTQTTERAAEAALGLLWLDCGRGPHEEAQLLV
jgi:hypothetical protein